MKCKWNVFLAAVAVLALSLGGTITPAIAQSVAPSVEGSWIFTVDLINQGTTFTAVTSFTAGGVFLATGSNDRVNPVSPLYGSWQRIRRHRFSSTAYFFAFDPANPNGAAVAMLRTNQVFQLKNQDELVGVGDLSSCDLQGQNCVDIAAGGIQIRGRRIVPENSIELSEMLPPE
jgi:hypothetical protein